MIKFKVLIQRSHDNIRDKIFKVESRQELLRKIAEIEFDKDKVEEGIKDFLYNMTVTSIGYHFYRSDDNNTNFYIVSEQEFDRFTFESLVEELKEISKADCKCNDEYKCKSCIARETLEEVFNIINQTLEKLDSIKE